jgi:hypothetical protein
MTATINTLIIKNITLNISVYEKSCLPSERIKTLISEADEIYSNIRHRLEIDPNDPAINSLLIDALSKLDSIKNLDSEILVYNNYNGSTLDKDILNSVIAILQVGIKKQAIKDKYLNFARDLTNDIYEGDIDELIYQAYSFHWILREVKTGPRVSWNGRHLHLQKHMALFPEFNPLPDTVIQFGEENKKELLAWMMKDLTKEHLSNPEILNPFGYSDCTNREFYYYYNELNKI